MRVGVFVSSILIEYGSTQCRAITVQLLLEDGIVLDMFAGSEWF